MRLTAKAMWWMHPCGKKKQNKKKVRKEILFSYKALSPCRGFKGNPDFGKFSFVGESGILGLMQSVIWNPTDDCNPETKFPWKGSGIQSMKSEIHGVESRIQTVLDSPELRWNQEIESNFNFQWTKTLYQNNLNDIAFFFTFFKGYRYN